MTLSKTTFFTLASSQWMVSSSTSTPDRQSATADVIASAGGKVLAHKFKF
jgi:hypothetical protein